MIRASKSVIKGRTLAAGRILTGMTVDTLAVQAGCTPEEVSAAECGEASPELMTSIRQALDRAGILIGQTDEMVCVDARYSCRASESGSSQ